MVLPVIALTMSLAVTPQIGFAPLTVRYIVRIAPDPQNRSECIGYTSEDGMETSHCWTIEGERAPRTTQVTWPDIGPGTYIAWAAVCYTDETACAKDPTNRRSVATRPLQVQGLGSSQ